MRAPLAGRLHYAHFQIAPTSSGRVEMANSNDNELGIIYHNTVQR
jgi:hypothetical protein